MIKLDRVSKAYGRGNRRIQAVRDACFEAGPSEMVVITGPSGSGKTTLLNLIGGMARPDRGDIFVGGESLAAFSDARLSRFRAESIGFVFQFQSMIGSLSAIENVRLPLMLSPKTGASRSAEALLEWVGLGGRMDAYVDELSMGEQRRVSIARALVRRPGLLLCDEPTGDLDPQTESVVMDLLLHAVGEGTSVLMVTHNPTLRRHGTRLLTCTQGRVTPEAEPDEVVDM